MHLTSALTSHQFPQHIKSEGVLILFNLKSFLVIMLSATRIATGFYLFCLVGLFLFWLKTEHVLYTVQKRILSLIKKTLIF